MSQQMEITVGDARTGAEIDEFLGELEKFVTNRGFYIVGCIGTGDIAGSMIAGPMSISNMLACHHVLGEAIEEIIKADRIDDAFMNGGNDAISH